MDVGVREAKNKLPALLRAVERGERVVICRHGRAIGELVLCGAAPTARDSEIISGDVPRSLAATARDIRAWMRGDR